MSGHLADTDSSATLTEPDNPQRAKLPSYFHIVASQYVLLYSFSTSPSIHELCDTKRDRQAFDTAYYLVILSLIQA